MDKLILCFLRNELSHNCHVSRNQGRRKLKKTNHQHLNSCLLWILSMLFPIQTMLNLTWWTLIKPWKTWTNQESRFFSGQYHAHKSVNFPNSKARPVCIPIPVTYEHIPPNSSMCIIAGKTSPSPKRPTQSKQTKVHVLNACSIMLGGWGSHILKNSWTVFQPR